MGVEATVNDRQVLVGSHRFMDRPQVRLARSVQQNLGAIQEKGASPLCIAVDGKWTGAIALADTARVEAYDVLCTLRQMGLREVVLLTGDHASVAKEVAKTLGISRCRAEVFPEEKVQVIKELQQEGYKVAIVGDGITDSPALAQADVGIATGHFSQARAEIAARTPTFIAASANMLMDDHRSGRLVEFGPTVGIFRNPRDSRTEAHLSGRFG